MSLGNNLFGTIKRSRLSQEMVVEKLGISK